MKKVSRIILFFALQLILILIYITVESAFIQKSYIHQKLLKEQSKLTEEKKILELKLASLQNLETLYTKAINENKMVPVTLTHMHKAPRS